MSKDIIQKNIGKIIEGHALEVLKEFPDESINCIITSPPYYNMRQYDTVPVKWNDGWIGELGLEESMQQYISHLCDIFDECKRVLKKDGTLWVNIADGYSSGASMTMQERISRELGKDTKLTQMKKRPKPKTKIAPKSLLGVPFRFAVEMLDNRQWILRNTIIWQKPNCSPSPVKDRFTNDFEYVFFFTKSKKYDFRQILEPLAEETIARSNRKWHNSAKLDSTFSGITKESNEAYAEKVKAGEIKGRNKRTVWSIPTQHNPKKHYATFPTKLIVPMILSGCKKEGIVLDIFAGSGTTLRVAKSLGRKGIGIELNPEFIQMAYELDSGWKDLGINDSDYANLNDLLGIKGAD